MATNVYITLENSDASLSKKFRVVMGTLQKVLNKQQNRRRTLTGQSDNQSGATFWSWAMTLLTHESGDLSGYGALADLEQFFELIDPSATPNTTLTFTDHLGNGWDVELVGTLTEEALTPYLDGDGAHYLIAIAMEQIDE